MSVLVIWTLANLRWSEWILKNTRNLESKAGSKTQRKNRIVNLFNFLCIYTFLACTHVSIYSFLFNPESSLLFSGSTPSGIIYFDLIVTFQYASSEFRQNYVPLWVFFRKWGIKGVCLRKRWGKCYMRCIVKFNFLAFIKWT